MTYQYFTWLNYTPNGVDSFECVTLRFHFPVSELRYVWSQQADAPLSLFFPFFFYSVRKRRKPENIKKKKNVVLQVDDKDVAAVIASQIISTSIGTIAPWFLLHRVVNLSNVIKNIFQKGRFRNDIVTREEGKERKSENGKQSERHRRRGGCKSCPGGDKGWWRVVQLRIRDRNTSF